MGSKSKPSGTTTTVQNSEPWVEQRPYLKTIFGDAQNLYKNYSPQYFPQNTYAPPNKLQDDAINNLWTRSIYDTTPQTAGNFSNRLLNGDFLRGDPSLAKLNTFADNNIVLGSGATKALSPLASTNYGGTVNPAFVPLRDIANDSSTLGSGTLSWFADNPAPNSGADKLLQFSDAPVANPGNAALTSYASGDRLAAGNPYMDALSQSVLSRVVPQIQSQFINSGTLASPEAARATAAGATSAISPFMFDQFQKEEQNQIGAANTLGQQALQSRGLQQSAAGNLADEIFKSYGLRTGAARDLGALGIQTRNSQANAAGQLGGMFLQGGGLMRDAASDLLSRELAGRGLQQQAAAAAGSSYQDSITNMARALGLAPQTQAMQYTPWEKLYNFGATRQNLEQAAIDDALARWNWQQNLPYDKLNYFAGTVGGDYGSTTTRQDPYFINRTSNALNGLAGAASVGSKLFGPWGGAIGGGLGLLSSTFF